MNRFVVVVTSGGPLPSAVGALLTAPDIDPLPYRPERHRNWTDETGRVHYAGWEAGNELSSVSDRRGVTAIAGVPRPRRGSWSAEKAVVDVIHELSGRPGWTPKELADAYALVRLDRDGTGSVSMDPFGFHPLYIATLAAMTVVGNRADLVAAMVAAATGVRAHRGVEAAQWLAFIGHHVGAHTGFSNVETLPCDTRLIIRDGRVHRERAPALFEHHPDEPGPSADEVADEVELDIASALRHAIARSDGPPSIELTGGKDSRLILAGAIRANLTNQLRFVTYGPRGLPDMEVASLIADQLGLHHVDVTDTHFAAAVAFSASSRWRRHVHRTCGASQCGDANEPPERAEWTVSGHVGELLRTAGSQLATHPPTTWEAAVRRFLEGRQVGEAGLLRPQHAAARLAEIEDDFLAARDRVRGPADLVPAWIAHCRYPRWQGPLVDHHNHTLMPLCSAEAVRSAFAMDSSAKDLELVHHKVIERASSELAAIPFANDRWRGPEMPIVEPVVGAATAKHITQANVRDERIDILLRLVDATPDHPLFEAVDPASLRTAIEGLGALRPLARLQVLGAATALIWLAREELPSR